MTPPFDEKRHSSGDAAVSSAPHTGAAEPPASPEPEAANPRLHSLPEEDGQESEAQDGNPSVPAGKPEAPTGPGPSAPAGDQPEGESIPDEQPDGDDHETKLEHDLDELSAKAQKADEYLELAQRTKADFENYRKRAAREAAAAQERGVVKLVRELLPAVDNLDRAVDAVAANGEGHAELISGLKLVQSEVIAALGRAGVDRFSPEGERFDPEYHEAVAQQPVDGAEPGTVAEVYQRGYRLGEAVIRPARVLVAG